MVSVSLGTGIAQSHRSWLLGSYVVEGVEELRELEFESEEQHLSWELVDPLHELVAL
jgi:hypothetical protein